MGTILLGIAFVPMLRFLKSGALVYGGDRGLYKDTFLSLIRYTTYNFDQSRLSDYILKTLLILSFSIIASSFCTMRSRKISLKNIF